MEEDENLLVNYKNFCEKTNMNVMAAFTPHFKPPIMLDALRRRGTQFSYKAHNTLQAKSI
jgi:hypothetical protein